MASAKRVSVPPRRQNVASNSGTIVANCHQHVLLHAILLCDALNDLRNQVSSPLVGAPSRKGGFLRNWRN
jgi:hypothetical protein